MPPFILPQSWQRVLTDQDKGCLRARFLSAVSQKATLRKSQLGTAPPLEAGSQKKFHAFLLHSKSHRTNNHRETRPRNDYVRKAHPHRKGYVSKLRIYFWGGMGVGKEKSNRMYQCNRVKSILPDLLKVVSSFISMNNTFFSLIRPQ